MLEMSISSVDIPNRRGPVSKYPIVTGGGGVSIGLPLAARSGKG